jgi:hypothetical protein
MHCLYASYARPVPNRIDGSTSREAACIACLSPLEPAGGRRGDGRPDVSGAGGDREDGPGHQLIAPGS